MDSDLTESSNINPALDQDQNYPQQSIPSDQSGQPQTPPAPSPSSQQPPSESQTSSPQPASQPDNFGIQKTAPIQPATPPELSTQATATPVSPTIITGETSVTPPGQPNPPEYPAEPQKIPIASQEESIPTPPSTSPPSQPSVSVPTQPTPITPQPATSTPISSESAPAYSPQVPTYIPPQPSTPLYGPPSPPSQPVATTSMPTPTPAEYYPPSAPAQPPAQPESPSAFAETSSAEPEDIFEQSPAWQPPAPTSTPVYPSYQTPTAKMDIGAPPQEPLTPPPTYTPPAAYYPEPKPSGAGIFIKIILILIILAGLATAFYFLVWTKGTLSLTIRPTDAQVLIDDKDYTGKNLNRIRLATGRHQLKITKQNYVEFLKEIEIKKMSRLGISVELKPIPNLAQLSEQKLAFITWNKEQTAILGLGNDGKTFYKITPGSTSQEGLEESEELEEKSTNETMLLQKAQAQNLTPEPKPETSATDKNSQESTDTTKSTKAKTQGQTVAISPDHFRNVINVAWHPEKTTAIIQIKNESSVLQGTPFLKSDLPDGVITTWLYDFKRYDLLNQEATFWSKDIGSITWSPDGEKIVYYYATSEGEKSLKIANKTNQNPERIYDMKDFENPQILWSPDGKTLALWSRSKKPTKNKLYLLDVYTKTPQEVTGINGVTGATFSPTSEQVLVTATTASQTSGKTPAATYLIDVVNLTFKDLAILTNVNQIAWKKDGSKIWYFSETEKENKIMSINLGDGSKNSYIFKTDQKILPKNLILSRDGKILYFLSEEILYSFNLQDASYEE